MLVALHLSCGDVAGRTKRQAVDFVMNAPPLGANNSFDSSFGPWGCLAEAVCQGQPCQNGGTCLFNASNCTFTCQCADGSLSDTLCQNVSGPTSTGPVDEKDCYQNGQIVCRHGRCAGKPPFVYCDCDDGWTGEFCEKECSLRCDNGGRCNVDAETKGQYCNCIYPWRGKTCSDTPPPVKDATWSYWLSGGLVVAFVVITVMFVLLTVFMWRRRFVLIMKVVFYFLPYEDNDGKLFDAFVSYRSCPRTWSLSTECCTRALSRISSSSSACMKEIFYRGNNRQQYPLGSRKQPSDNTSSFPKLPAERMDKILTSDLSHRFEYQQAQQEMLKRKQKIIPIMFQDVSDHLDAMDKTLKTILQSVTYLDLPKAASDQQRLEKFWKRLQLSMPKKKDSSDSTAIKGQEKDNNVQLVSLRFIQAGWTMESDTCRGELEAIARAHERTLDDVLKEKRKGILIRGHTDSRYLNLRCLARRDPRAGDSLSCFWPHINTHRPE
ncbi:hypothetical protein C0Q70_16250 [Pomacea canaliculata]|uniref:EGF-like domain-containing protein n=1 Tax=Pomacea canaliculata TaxID=400727 RepID=A0A2T7NP90_POMCA|nr:hypothetical protein C0Q70_16250 [Pomacea canaliculata]